MRASGIKGFERYERRVFIGGSLKEDDGFLLTRRGSERTLHAGNEFYIRKATSSDGYRVIFEDTGPTVIYTVDAEQKFNLMEESEPA